MEDRLGPNELIFDHQYQSLIFDFLSSILDPHFSILNPRFSILHLRFLLFGLVLPFAGADLAPLLFAGALPPVVTPGLVACSLTLAEPGVGAAGVSKLLGSSGFAGTGTGAMVGSASYFLM